MIDLLKSLTVKDYLVAYQFVTAIFATIYFCKYKYTVLKIFLPFIWISAFNDIIGMYYTQNCDTNNSIVCNIYQIIETTFYLYLFISSIKNSAFKKILKILLRFYYLAYFIYIFVLNHNILTEYFDSMFMLGSSSIVLGVIFYFYEVLNSDKIIYVHTEFLFWLSTALLIYFVPAIPFMFVVKYYKNSNTLPYLFNINFGLGYIFNTLVIYGLICCKEAQQN